ncbi:TPA: hypothetical protein DCY65_05425, partial [Candidatus Acetothermia bacterium]|nr:hypothetical protein [Candidatus Acetothermia bacterium]
PLGEGIGVRDIDVQFAEKSWGSRFGGSTEGPTTMVTKGTKKYGGHRFWGSEKRDSFVPWW